MTREEVKEYLPLLQAFAEGKTIQTRNSNGWADIANPLFVDSPSDYRIKPTPTYRPFKDGKELVAEYCKRFGVERKAWGLPFMWVKPKNRDMNFIITALTNGVVLTVGRANTTTVDLLDNYTFLDGSPCGVMEASDERSE